MAAMDESPDPAAIFACAKSLHDACLQRAEVERAADLSEAYQGFDSFMREVMRVADLFERWACRHVAFPELDEVWPYLLEQRFGAACLDFIEPGSLTSFDADDCLRIAFQLRLPLRLDENLPLPVCVEAPNPSARAVLRRLRIQTVRSEWDDDGEVVPFTEDDDPFDENYRTPVFAIYGVDDEGILEHITDLPTYRAARSLLLKLFPSIALSEHVVAFPRNVSAR